MNAPATNGDGSGYFLYHSIGVYPQKAADMANALGEFSAGWGASNDSQWTYAFAARQQFIDAWSALIAAPPGTLTTTENVTSALHSLISALPKNHLQGKKLLVAADCFPSLHFLLTGLAERFGFSLETVPLRQGENWVHDDDVITHWTPDVGLALLTWVTSTNSHRSDLDRLVEHGRRMGSLIGVDITQAVGLLPFRVDRPDIDFAISTSLKWLCATPGAGILQVAHNLLKQCTPELRGWFSQDDIFSWDIDKFAYAPDIRRFDNGTPSIMACVGSVPALNWHAAQDMAAMLVHNRRLSARIIDGTRDLGMTLVTPQNESERGGSVMVRMRDGTDPNSVLDHLRSRKIYADHRGPILRFSPGFVTTDAGVDNLLEGLGAMLA